MFSGRIVSVRETRITGILSHVFIGLSLLFIDQLQLIPRPVLDGLFLYLAVTALHCNQLFERIMLLVTEQVGLHLSDSLNMNRAGGTTPVSPGQGGGSRMLRGLMLHMEIFF